MGLRCHKIFWRFWYADKTWADNSFDTYYAKDPIDGVMYAGVTLFRYSLLYSETW